jgi:2-polyprenyl-3-methyl-5-hydroxy-6-metoxy-1,4-benzoquinol methylase
MKHQECLICKSPQLNPLKGYESHHLVKCASCNFVFAGLIPTIKELETHYDTYDRAPYVSPITVKRYHELLDTFEPYRKNNTILDWGCGSGDFLVEAKKRGWNVYGTEYTDEAFNACTQKGINIHKGPLDVKNYTQGFFDVITSFEVFEHINNPLTEVDHFRFLLRGGGLHYLTTPNFNALARYQLKDKYNIITYPEHLSYYTMKTLKKVFKDNGFSVKKIETTGISITRFKTSMGTSQQSLISEASDDEKLRVQIENNNLLQMGKKVANSTFTFLGIGSTLKGYFEKL